MTTPAEFERGLKRAALHRSGAFALHLCWLDEPGGDLGAPLIDGGMPRPTWRLGLVIPKRHEPTAVGRNTIKRRWRDAFRRGRASLAREFGSADLVVRLQSSLVPKPPKASGKTRAAARGEARRRGPTEATDGQRATASVVSGPSGQGSKRASAGAAPLPARRVPAQVRAREQFDPERLLDALAERLRSRGGRPAARDTLAAPVAAPVVPATAARASPVDRGPA